jgi:hypothetical protein
MELFAMSATLSRVRWMRETGHADARDAAALADVFCRNSRRRIRALFHELWHNDDVAKYRLAQRVLEGRYAWMETGVIGASELEEARKSDGRHAGVGS